MLCILNEMVHTDTIPMENQIMIPEINPYTITTDEFLKIFTVGEDRSGINSALMVDFLSEDEINTLSAWWANQREYFKLDLETKEKHSYSPKHHVGFERYRMHRFFTERFYYYTSRMEHVGWPEQLDRELAMKCVAIKDRLTMRILAILDDIVGGTALVDAHKHESLNVSGILYYPAYEGPVYRKNLRHDIHADYNLITLFFQQPNEIGKTCFQVRDLQSKWHDVQYKPYAATLCLSNLLEYWSNTYFKCSPHQVINEAIEHTRFINTHYVMPSLGTTCNPLLNYKLGEDVNLENRYAETTYTIPASKPRIFVDSFTPVRDINRGWQG
jgi:isopenicillin N synthase-like dioxygenase